jgi:hypothetical protein
MNGSGVVPIRFDMSALVRRSVASLYSHLVTRPTGQALRLGIETQLSELGAVCVSVLDFGQVVVLDYSCADEAVAKLIRRYAAEDRPADAYFVARGVDEHHRETLEAVLHRHDLALVADVTGIGFTVLGRLTPEQAAAWRALAQLGEGRASQVAAGISAAEEEADHLLASLAERRLLMRRSGAGSAMYLALPALVGGV